MRIGDRKGVSPVITTVIIVAIGIAVAIAAALWMGGLVGLFTKFEQIEVRNKWVDSSGTNFVVNLVFNNTGTTDTSITDVILNGKPYNVWNPQPSLDKDLPISLPIGRGVHLRITIPRGAASGESRLVSGVSLTVTLHTSGGKDISATVSLP